MQIGLLVIATHKYMMLADPLVASVREHFMRDTTHETTVFLFTNRRRVPDGTVRIHQEYRPFPYPALMRYHAYHRSRDVLSKMDCLYSCDVDMRFVARVGEEILGDLVATIPPYFWLALEKTHLKPVLPEPWLARSLRRTKAVVRRHLLGRR